MMPRAAAQRGRAAGQWRHVSEITQVKGVLQVTGARSYLMHSFGP